MVLDKFLYMLKLELFLWLTKWGRSVTLLNYLYYAFWDFGTLQSYMWSPVLCKRTLKTVFLQNIGGALPICDLPRHFHSNMWSTSRNPSYRKWRTPCNPLADKYTNRGMCCLVIFVAQFTCLRFDVRNRQQCRATWNSLKQLYVARKWL